MFGPNGAKSISRLKVSVTPRLFGFGVGVKTPDALRSLTVAVPLGALRNRAREQAEHVRIFHTESLP